MILNMYPLKIKILSLFVLCPLIVANIAGVILAENLESVNYTIQDATLNSGGDALVSTNFDLLSSLGDITADNRLISGSYELETGFPNGLLADIPIINCFETVTNSSNSTCQHFPQANGSQGECGFAGCYNKAKIEIDSQENPTDAVYLVKLKTTDNTEYYLKSDHTLGSSFDSSNFMTKCQLEGIDLNNLDCDASGDSGWNENLQSNNIFGLSSTTQYEASVMALNGDFTGTDFSEAEIATTTNPQMAFDLDIGLESNPIVESSTPYNIILEGISYLFPTTATNLIWFDMASNLPKGFNVYLKSKNEGLVSASKSASILSETEDLSTDLNNNGGYGVKTYNYTPAETTLGPLLRASLFDTSSENSVGALTTENNQLFYTNDLSSNRGELLGGRAALYIKARAAAITPASSDYTDTLTTVVVGNF